MNDKITQNNGGTWEERKSVSQKVHSSIDLMRKSDRV